MDNRQIAQNFDLLAKLYELHGENPFKIRSYSTAYQVIRKIEGKVEEMDEEALLNIKGIGKAVAGKIKEFLTTGEIRALEEVKAKTPAGLIDVLSLKGLGPKKISLLWKELQITSIGELEYACVENRLTKIKGFGQKTQQNILDQIDFIKKHAGQVLLPVAIEMGDLVRDLLLNNFKDDLFEISGQLRRKMDRVDTIEIVGTQELLKVREMLKQLEGIKVKGSEMHFNGLQLTYHETNPEEFGSTLFRTTGPEAFVSLFNVPKASEEKLVFHHNEQLEIFPVLRDLPSTGLIEIQNELINESAIKGVFHAHSTWSDGAATIRQMADACIERGYEYLVLTDHSKSAFYANGLTEERLFQQWQEIDAINQNTAGFKVFKGIESDILFNGDLDYSSEFLDRFEIVIASIHSNLKMDLDKANERLIKAIENPHTHILGHMTGRLLLSRPGYPVDHKKIIDACAANNVVIEINSNPRRLDIDWRWIPRALEKGVEICLSPDAHNTNGIEDMKYGVWMGQKGGVTLDTCLNTKDANGIEAWAKSK